MWDTADKTPLLTPPPSLPLPQHTLIITRQHTHTASLMQMFWTGSLSFNGGHEAFFGRLLFSTGPSPRSCCLKQLTVCSEYHWPVPSERAKCLTCSLLLHSQSTRLLLCGRPCPQQLTQFAQSAVVLPPFGCDIQFATLTLSTKKCSNLILIRNGVCLIPLINE